MINDFNLEITSKILEGFSEENILEVKDLIAITLFNSIFEKTRSILILNKNDQVVGVDTLTRSAFEAKQHLKFILERYSDRRAMAYYLSNQLKEIEMGEIIYGEDSVGASIRNFIEKRGYNYEMDFMNDNLKIDLIKNEFNKLTNQKKSDKWMAVQRKRNGKGDLLSFRDICEYLGEEDLIQYEMIYRVLSKEVHSKDFKSYMEVLKNEGVIHFREPKSSRLIEPFLKGIVLEAGKLMTKEYNLNKEYKKLKNLN